jgi:hypothetical protein
MKRIHWMRAFVYSFIAEVAIFAVVLPVGLLLGAKAGVYSVPFFSFAVMWLAAELIGRRVERRALHGALIGIFGTALYIIVPLILTALFGQLPGGGPPPEVQALAGITAWLYPVSHVLKVLGGALGGLVADRRVYEKPATVVQAQTESHLVGK